MSLWSRIKGLLLLAMLLAIPMVVCSTITSFAFAIQSIIFLLAAIIPLVAGMLLIFRYAADNEKLAFVLTAALIGFTFFSVAFLGMTMDPKSANLPWLSRLTIAFGIGVFTALFSAMGTRMYAFLFKLFQ